MITIDKDLGVEFRDEGPWRSYYLNTYGVNSEEMLANASVTEIDQDGGELVTYELSDCSGEVLAAVEREVLHAFGIASLKEAANV